jgi:hypothetical protein
VTTSFARACAGISSVLSAAAILLPGTAVAGTPNCDSISGGAPIIYGAGGTGPRDVLGAAAVQLEQSDEPIFIVYQDQGSCTGVYPLTGLSGSTITGTAYYWPVETGTKTVCNLSLSGDEVDFGMTDVNAINCPLLNGDESYLAGITEATGPIDPVNVLVPVGSTQQVISAEAFYLVYGLGAAAGIEPWTNSDPTYFQRRNDDSGTQVMISLAAGIPVDKYIGTDAGGGSALVANLAALAVPEEGIGFATAATGDGSRTSVRNLAWQGIGQNVGYWADSDATSFDKRNVRDGLYDIWDPIHLWAKSGASAGTYENSDVQTLADYFSGKNTPSGTPKIMDEVAVATKVVPVCAMHATRDTTGGSIYAVEPDAPCDCYFDFSTTGATSCDSCDDSNPCSGTDVCRLGFCEAY